MRTANRRHMLAGLAATALAGRARARTPEPEPGFGGLVGWALVDAGTGALIEGHDADTPRPPASVAKCLTALMALDRLGPAHVFRTEIRAAPGAGGPDDLVLAGGGDPLLDTDALGALVAAADLRRGFGRFLVAEGALPPVAAIAADQPPLATYNPAISGMNLNFNRVLLDWAPGPEGPRLALIAPGERFATAVDGIGVVLGDSAPRHGWAGVREVWTLPRAAVAGTGQQWLPVRAPARYAGETLRALAGGALPEPEVVRAAPPGRVLAWHSSPPLRRMMIDMLDYSTNLTAEAVGLAATGATDLADSGRAMTDWAARRYGLAGAVFVNHSGLTVASRLSPRAMAGLLVRAQAEGLPDMLERRALRDAGGGEMAVAGLVLRAKTGTLDFVSALAGYLEQDGQRRAFAIFAADPAARAAIPPERRDDPPGAATWARRARAQEQALLRRWAGV